MIHHPWNWWNLAKKKSHPSLVIETHGTNMVGFINLGWCTQDAFKEYSTAAKSKLGFLLVKHLVEVILMAGIPEKDINHPTESCHLTLPPQRQKSFPHPKKKHRTTARRFWEFGGVFCFTHPIFSPIGKKIQLFQKVAQRTSWELFGEVQKPAFCWGAPVTWQIWGQGVPLFQRRPKI